jgi:hypothetical protein
MLLLLLLLLLLLTLLLVTLELLDSSSLSESFALLGMRNNEKNSQDTKRTDC